jgi:hypothetical protein
VERDNDIASHFIYPGRCLAPCLFLTKPAPVGSFIGPAASKSRKTVSLASLSAAMRPLCHLPSSQCREHFATASGAPYYG